MCTAFQIHNIGESCLCPLLSIPTLEAHIGCQVEDTKLKQAQDVPVAKLYFEMRQLLYFNNDKRWRVIHYKLIS